MRLYVWVYRFLLFKCQSRSLGDSTGGEREVETIDEERHEEGFVQKQEVSADLFMLLEAKFKEKQTTLFRHLLLSLWVVPVWPVLFYVLLVA